MQIPTQPPQAEVEIAKESIRAYLAKHPGYLVTPHGLVDDGIVGRYEGADGYPLDVSISAIDDLIEGGVLKEIGLHTYRRAGF